jgi:hypothetical protein
MDLVGTLKARHDEVLRDAVERLGHAHLTHYEISGPDASRQRLSDLLDLVVDCLTERSLGSICDYAETVAQERFEAGFDIAEVQTAFNVLEEALWRQVISQLDSGDLAEGTGLIGTALGAGKDTLARTWVSLASSQHVHSLDLTALFEGVAS